MASKKAGSQGDKIRYTRYKAEGRYEKNKKRKVAKHIKNHPNDEAAKNSLKGGYSYSRKAPKTRTVFYSRPWKDFASTLKKVSSSAKNIDYYTKLERAVYD